MEGEQSAEQRINKGISLQRVKFARSQGIFNNIYDGEITELVRRFNKKIDDPGNTSKLIESQTVILNLLSERDEQGRIPLDLACFLGFKNISLYLITKMGAPEDVIKQEINIDNMGRNCYHNMCYKGNYDVMVVLLNIERVYLKKMLFDQLLQLKNDFKFKNMDIKHGALASSVFHDPDSVKRHEDFNIRVYNLFEQYAKDIQDRYRQILTQQDELKRNPIHYGAMSKYTKCYKTLEAILNINIDLVPGTEDFLTLFFQIQELESKEDMKFDPRKYKSVLGEFKHLLSPNDYNRIIKEFKQQIKILLIEVLNCQDKNLHTPLHISSYYGDFKQSRLFTSKGAKATSAANAVAPLEVCKGKESRDVLQSLNEAASTANVNDLEYLVNCGEKIDSRSSIVGQAPIHKAVLSKQLDKSKTLDKIFKSNADVNIIDSNGWTAIHHAAFQGDLQSVNQLKQSGANINAFSNQFKTPLHFAALNDKVEVVESLLASNANMEARDEQKCTPLHLACRKGSLSCIKLLLQQQADIMALDNRQWTPLHYCSYNGHPKAVNTLLKWEADIDKLSRVKNSQGRIAFIISKDDYVKKAFNHIWKACKDGDLDMVRIMIREGQSSVEPTQKVGNTPLHIAARNGHYLIVKYLIDNGAPVDTKNKDGYTPREYLQGVLLSLNAKQRIQKQLDALKGQTDKEKMKEKAKMVKELEKQDLLAKTGDLLMAAANGAYQRA